MNRTEIDNTFNSLIDKSAELIKMARPQTSFDALKPHKPVVRIELDFSLISSIQSSSRPLFHSEYDMLFSELKRFEPSALTFSSIEPGQGVSFTASNIARLWAQEDNTRVLLLEFYNGSSGCEYQSVTDEEALSVSDPQLLEDYITCAEADNLYLLSIRSASIKSPIDEFWTRLTSSFDLIIIDAAPKGFNIMTDQAISRSTGVILISATKPDPVSVKVFEQDTKDLDGRFLGVILNAMD